MSRVAIQALAYMGVYLLVLTSASPADALVGLALGVDDAPAHPTSATVASRPRPSMRTAMRMTTSDDAVLFRIRPRRRGG